MKRLGVLIGIAVAIFIAGCAPIAQDQAQTELAAGRLDEAANDGTPALKRDPGNPKLKALGAEIFTRRGVQYYQQGVMLQAADDFHNAVSYQPTNAAAWDYLGMIAFQQHNWQDAINFGNKAASLDGKPDPGYVVDARKELLKVQSGGFRPYKPVKPSRYGGSANAPPPPPYNSVPGGGY